MSIESAAAAPAAAASQLSLALAARYIRPGRCVPCEALRNKLTFNGRRLTVLASVVTLPEDRRRCKLCSVRLSVPDKLHTESSFLFLDGIEPVLGRQFFMWHSTKAFSYIFLLRPPNAQNLFPKICTKSPITRLVWHIDRRCLGLPGGPTTREATLVAMETTFGLGAEI